LPTATSVPRFAPALLAGCLDGIGDGQKVESAASAFDNGAC